MPTHEAAAEKQENDTKYRSNFYARYCALALAAAAGGRKVFGFSCPQFAFSFAEQTTCPEVLFAFAVMQLV